jgi:hypothetical protein
MSVQPFNEVCVKSSQVVSHDIFSCLPSRQGTEGIVSCNLDRAGAGIFAKEKFGPLRVVVAGCVEAPLVFVEAFADIFRAVSDD